VSHLLEMLGKALDGGLADRLGHYFHTNAALGVDELTARAKAQPLRGDIQVRLGLAYLRAGQGAEAVQQLERACQSAPTDLAAHLALACAREETGQTLEALEEIQQVQRVHGGDPLVTFCLGLMLEKTARPEDAAAAYRQAIEINPELLAARQRLAAIALVNHDLDEAIGQYDWIVQQNPADTQARATLGQLCYRAGDFAEAVRHFEDAIAMEPENWALADEQVEALMAAGRFPEAIERLREMLEMQGDFPDLHLRLADLYDRVGQDEQAQLHYQAALDLQPNYLEALVRLGTHHLMHGRWAEASEAFAGAVELNDALMTAYVGLGVAQSAGGQDAAALATFDLAAALEPNSSLLMREMARLQLKSALASQLPAAADAPAQLEAKNLACPEGHELLAVQLERHAEHVRREPMHADVRYRNGVLLRAEGRSAEALEQFEAAITLNPSYTQAIIKKGVTLLELKRPPEALAAFTAAMELQPQYVDLHYRLALLYTDGRQFEQAVRQVEAAFAATEGHATRARLALALQQMGLLDRAAATWRSLQKTFHIATAGKPA
jgi:tetratricopeptide (TPR) repeat protein